MEKLFFRGFHDHSKSLFPMFLRKKNEHSVQKQPIRGGGQAGVSANSWGSGHKFQFKEIEEGGKPVMCNSDSRIGTGIEIPGIFRAYGIGIGIESKAEIT